MAFSDHLKVYFILNKHPDTACLNKSQFMCPKTHPYLLKYLSILMKVHRRLKKKGKVFPILFYLQELYHCHCSFTNDTCPLV